MPKTSSALFNAALNGKLLATQYCVDPVFGFQVPRTCEGVPADVLDPAGSWKDKELYITKYRQLASRFIDNLKKYLSECPPDIVKAGPHM